MMGKIRDVESSGKFIAENFISFDKENVIILDIIENNREELGL